MKKNIIVFFANIENLTKIMIMFVWTVGKKINQVIQLVNVTHC